MRRLLLMGCVLAQLACGVHAGKSETSSAPVKHRTDDGQCRSAVPAGDDYPQLDPSDSRFACRSDADCAEGVNGRCVGSPGPAGSSCVVDACVGDGDCPTQQTCACHGSAYMSPYGNTCVPGNCRTDADCKSKPGYCSPAPQASMCGNSVAGYYCRTSADTCTDDSDCSRGVCTYAADARHWACRDAEPGC